MDEHRRKLVAIVFTDIVGFTEITSSDEGEAIRLLQWQRNTFQPMVKEHGGEWLKELGDGLLLSFSSSQDAVRCAIRIQEATREKPDLQIRIGIHQGNIIQEGPDILGDGVNIASRLQQIAPKGGIALSDKVQQDISGYPEFEVISLGQHSLKGVARSMGIYCLSPFGLPEIPEYRLLRLTGQGAYGEVWLAQSLTGVYRAVKIVHRDQFEDAKPYEREFTGITEYEPVSRKHEGLIDLLHVGHGQDDSFFYYVMELADDQRAREEINPREYRPRTLQSELEARGKLSIGECLEVGSRLARGLAFLHDHNLLHRDVKPANIVYVDGHPKLADIGLVTTMDNASTLVGTMGYIPPEGPGKPSSDIYALGMVLYELSTGKDRADFPEIDVLDPELKGLNQACLKACSNDLSERFANAHAFADELDQLALGKSTPDSAASSPQSSNLKMGALAAALIAILALVLYQKSGDSNGENGKKSEPAIGSPSRSTANFDLTEDLVAYYPFNGNANDESGNGNDGTVSGALPVKDRSGKQNSALVFDGNDDYVSLGQNTAFALPDRISISVWVKTTDDSGWIFARWNDRNLHFQSYGLKINNKAPQLWLNGLGKMDDFSLASDKTSFGEGQWHQIVATWDRAGGSDNTKIYVDGSLNCQKTSPSSFLTIPLIPAQIGGGVGLLGSSYFKGSIDDIRIYSRALTDKEIAALYNLEKPKDGLEKGLVAYYPFNGNANDESGNGNDGEMRGGAFSEDRHGTPNACKEGGAVALPQLLAGQFGGDAPITVSIWAQHAAAPRNQGLFGIGSNRLHRGFGLFSESGKLCFSRWEDRVPTDYIFPEGQWAHCLVTHDGTTLKVYVNGKEVLSNEIHVDRLIGEAVLGCGPYSAWRDSFLGSLDDVRIYNRALLPEEVAKLYDIEKPKE
jgi:serine/threonine protein kinase